MRTQAAERGHMRAAVSAPEEPPGPWRMGGARTGAACPVKLRVHFHALSSRPDGQLQTMANAIRALAMDAVQQANLATRRPDGHGRHGVALWGQHLQHNPANPHWGQPRPPSCALQRPRLDADLRPAALTGYDLPLQELKNFRQLHSKTAGHPRSGRDPRRGNHHRAAGPGYHQRRAGMALAEKLLASEFQPATATPSSTTTPTFLGDGC